MIQSDDDLQLSAFLFSNDKFNIKDSIDFCAEEYVKYKNRLKKEIVKFVDNNDYSNMSYGEMLELVLENVIAFNQGKNVFNDEKELDIYEEKNQKVLYEVVHSKKFRSGELHYVDHPKFGMLIKLSKAQKKISSPDSGLTKN